MSSGKVICPVCPEECTLTLDPDGLLPTHTYMEREWFLSSEREPRVSFGICAGSGRTITEAQKIPKRLANEIVIRHTLSPEELGQRRPKRGSEK